MQLRACLAEISELKNHSYWSWMNINMVVRFRWQKNAHKQTDGRCGAESWHLNHGHRFRTPSGGQHLPSLDRDSRRRIVCKSVSLSEAIKSGPRGRRRRRTTNETCPNISATAAASAIDYSNRQCDSSGSHSQNQNIVLISISILQVVLR